MSDAYYLLSPMLGKKTAGLLFGIALLASGQVSTITGTLAGQVGSSNSGSGSSSGDRKRKRRVVYHAFTMRERYISDGAMHMPPRAPPPPPPPPPLLFSFLYSLPRPSFSSIYRSSWKAS